MDRTRDFVDRSPAYIGSGELFAQSDNGGWFEILAAMIEVDPTTRELETVPKSKQELLEATEVSKSTLDRRFNEDFKELNIINSKTGQDYDQIDDFDRVFELKRGRISDEHLREIKKKGWFRYREDEFENVHANDKGGESTFLNLPDWSSFVDQHLHG